MPLVQPAYSLKLTNQSSVPAKSTNQSSLFTPIAPSNSSALAKPPSSSGVSDTNYSDWSPWSSCSATCGHQAVTHRKRTCKLIGGKTCQGSNTETKQCQFFRCPGIARKNKQSLSVSWIGLAGNWETQGDRLYIYLHLSKLSGGGGMDHYFIVHLLDFSGSSVRNFTHRLTNTSLHFGSTKLGFNFKLKKVEILKET